MIRRKRFLVLLLLALPIPALLPRALPPGWRPDCFAFLFLLAALCSRSEEALPLVWGVGLAKDLLSAGPLGQYALMYMAAGYVLLRVRDVLTVRTIPVRAALAFLMVLLTESISTLLNAGFHPRPIEMQQVLLGAVVTAVLAPLILRYLERAALPPRRA